MLLVLTRFCLGWAAPFRAEIHSPPPLPGDSSFKSVLGESCFVNQYLLAQPLPVGLRVTQFSGVNANSDCVLWKVFPRTEAHGRLIGFQLFLLY